MANNEHELHISIEKFVDNNRSFFKILISGNLDHDVCKQFNSMRESANQTLDQFENAKSFTALKSKLSNNPDAVHVLQRIAQAFSLEDNRAQIAKLLKNSEHERVLTFKDVVDDFHMSGVQGGVTEVIEQLNGTLDDLRSYMATHTAARNITLASTQWMVRLSPQVNLGHEKSFVSKIGEFTTAPAANIEPTPSGPDIGPSEPKGP